MQAVRLHDRLPRAAFAVLASLAFAGFAGAAAAGSFSVTPVRVDLAAGTRVGVLTVRNDDQHPVTIEVQPLKWQLQDGNDITTPTRDVLATPPLFKLEPGAEQIIRVALRAPAPTDKEGSYRLMLAEVPARATLARQEKQLQVALRLSVPVWVAAAQPTKPDVQWSVTALPSQQVRVRAENHGSGHLQVADFHVKQNSSAQPLARQPVAFYLLPGQSREWTLETSGALASLGEVLLDGSTQRGPLSVRVPVGR